MSEQFHALIIDDDELSTEVLTRLLNMNEFTSTVIYDPAKLNETLANLDSVHVIFLDLELPHLDGYEVFDLLRGQLGESVPIVGYSVHTSESIAAMERGFDAFLGKPVDGRAFADSLQRIMSGERLRKT